MEPQSSSKLTFDVHIHLAGTGQGCASGCSMHPELRKRYTVKLLQILHRVSNRELEHDFDGRWGQKISTLVAESPVDWGVVLGFDGVVDGHGQLDPRRSQLIIPPAWVFQICRRHKNLLPGPSINPHRQEAMASLEFCLENKAVLIKWLPSAQLINLNDRYLQPFYKKLAEHGIPLLIHCGGEKTFFSYDPSLNQVSHLLAPLDAGVKVICAHTGTRVLGSRDPDELPFLRRLLKEYPHLWVDNSGLCNPSRYKHLFSLGQDPLIRERTLYGSDWPVPANAYYYLAAMGVKQVISLEKEKNMIARDIAIKRFFGYSDESLSRASQVLANLSHWTC